MSRIGQKFKQLADETAFVGFVTAGDPTVEHTVKAMHALVRGGTDIIELGVPFSDPEAEGPAIQASSERALANGVSLDDVLAMTKAFRQEDQTTPVVLMGYLNSFLAHPNLGSAAEAAGVDGFIIVNLPPEEASELRAELKPLGLDLIFLVAPTTTDERAKYIASQASGFLYYVSLKGITGADHLETEAVSERLSALKAVSEIPVCVGFGIKDADTARSLGTMADGVVVGSALVNAMAQFPDDVDGCATHLQALSQTIADGAKQR